MTSRVRLLASVLAAAALCALTPAATADTGGLRLTPVGKPRFPDRSFALSLPVGHSIGAERVRVTENGRAVGDASVSPASASGREFGVVLALDASLSMRGQPIKDAMTAARAFAARRSRTQPLGIVAFNSEAATVLSLTTDPQEIQDALAAAPPLRRETHLYDGVDEGVALLEAAGATTGSVVVLSDGSDTGSALSLQAAAKRARAAGVRVFAVGLASSAFKPKALKQLASGARGRYSEASGSGELASIYDQLGAELAREHLIQYRSLAGPRRQVTVRAAVDGVGDATVTYRSPGTASAAAPPYDRNDFWGSPLALVLVSLACGTLVAVTLHTAFARPGRRRLRERMSQFVAPSAPDEPESARALRGGRIRAALDRGLNRVDWWPGFKEELEIAGVKMEPIHFVSAIAAGALAAGWLVQAVAGNLLLGAFVVIAVPLVARVMVMQHADQQRRLFADQLADDLQVIASAQRAGHSFIGALAVSTDEAPEPTKTEFERALADEQLGLPIEDGLGVVARRMKSRDLEQVILVARLQRETGGNTAEVLDRVADTVRERGELRRLIASLTVQGRMSRWIVTALPILLLVLVSAINPRYMDPLFETTPGKLALGFAAFLLVAGSLAIKRIVSIGV